MVDQASRAAVAGAQWAGLFLSHAGLPPSTVALPLLDPSPVLHCIIHRPWYCIFFFWGCPMQVHDLHTNLKPFSVWLMHSWATHLFCYGAANVLWYSSLLCSFSGMKTGKHNHTDLLLQTSGTSTQNDQWLPSPAYWKDVPVPSPTSVYLLCIRA